MRPDWLGGVIRILAAFVAGAAGSATSAQTSSGVSEERGLRPRIGLVLAGGGARGIGHVGVIQLLEELNIQIDCVAGTSMGSIVGGLYSAGYTSKEMLDWLAQCDWDHMLSDALPRPQRGFRVKAEELETPRWIEFGIDRTGVKTPNAFISGQNLLVALRERTSFVGFQTSFDHLPVPFRAVATDVETGAMVVLDRGRLADAMRASMAVPGAFAPYTIDGRVLIDGFASRNLPVSVARDMGVDIVIAVDVRAELLPADQLTSPIGMAEQLLSILSQRDTLEQIRTLGSRDIIVRLKLPGFTSSSFREALTIAQRGYEEAQQTRAGLQVLSLPPEIYTAREASRRRLRRDLPVIAAIEVEGSGTLAEAAVRKRLDILPGEQLDPERLRASLGRVHDLGYFRRVDYRIDDRPEGRVLVISTEPKPWGPNFVVFGIGLGSDLDGASELNVRTSLRFTQLNRYGAELGIKTSLGNIDRFDAEFLQPVGELGLFFTAPRAEFLRKPEFYSVDLASVVPGARPLNISFQRQTTFAGIAGGVRLGVDGELRFGVERGAVQYSKIRAPSIIVIGADGSVQAVDVADGFKDYTANRGYTSLTLDHLDHPFFPRRGLFLQGRIEREFGNQGSTTAGLFATAPLSFGRLVVQPRLAIDRTLKAAENSGRLPFRLGGLFNLSGVPSDEIFGLNTVASALIVRKGIGGTLTRPAYYFGGSFEAGNSWNETGRALPQDWIFAASAFLATDTPIGPIHLAVGKAERRQPALYFYLGRVLP